MSKVTKAGGPPPNLMYEGAHIQSQACTSKRWGIELIIFGVAKGHTDLRYLRPVLSLMSSSAMQGFLLSSSLNFL